MKKSDSCRRKNLLSTNDVGSGRVALYSKVGKIGIETEYMTKTFVMQLFSMLYDEAVKDGGQL